MQLGIEVTTNPSSPPPSVITVQNDQVTEIKEGVLWNGEPCEVIKITRIKDGFKCIVNDPEHGGDRGKDGSLEEILRPFHPDVAAKYRAALTSQNPTQEELVKLFPGFEIKIA